MEYPKIRYVEIRTGYHLLHSFDGTVRGVIFENEEAATAAMIPGRADMDVVAIESGFLPRGATLVSRAVAGDIDKIMAEVGESVGQVGPLARIRLQFSVKLLSDRSKWISHDEDFAARSASPIKATRYEAIVDELVRFYRDSEAS